MDEVAKVVEEKPVSLRPKTNLHYILGLVINRATTDGVRDVAYQ